MSKRTTFVNAALIFASATFLMAQPTHAAIESRNILKTFFETGDVPTQDQFGDVIDSYVHQTDDGLTLVGVGLDNSRGIPAASRKFEDDVIDITTAFADPSTHPPVTPDWAGQSGFLPLEYEDSSKQLHYGYLQMRMDPEAGASPVTGPAIHVDYWVWDTTAGEALTAEFVPEPASTSLLILAVCGTLRRRFRGNRD